MIMDEPLDLHLLNHILVSLVHVRSQPEIDKIVKEIIVVAKPNARTLALAKEFTLTRRAQITEANDD